VNVDPEVRDLHVSWPSNWQHKHPSKRADIRKLEWATARELAEQDLWRDRLESLRKLDLPGDALERMVDFDIDRLFRQMEEAGAKYPPTWEDEKAWFEHQGKEWHWSMAISDRWAAKIADKEISSEVYWLLQYGQHKERIKALALFASILQVDPDSNETYIAFTFWKVLAIHDELRASHGDLPETQQT